MRSKIRRQVTEPLDLAQAFGKELGVRILRNALLKPHNIYYGTNSICVQIKVLLGHITVTVAYIDPNTREKKRLNLHLALHRSRTAAVIQTCLSR